MSGGSWRSPKGVGRARRQRGVGDQSKPGRQHGRGDPKRRQAWRDRRRSAARLTNETAGHFDRRLIARRGGRAIRAAIVRRGACLSGCRKHWAIDKAHGARDAAAGERDNHKCREPHLAHCAMILPTPHYLVNGLRLNPYARAPRRPPGLGCGSTSHRLGWTAGFPRRPGKQGRRSVGAALRDWQGQKCNAETAVSAPAVSHPTPRLPPRKPAAGGEPGCVSRRRAELPRCGRRGL